MNIAILRWALAAAATLTVGAAAGDGSDNFRHKRPEFRVVNLSSLGGSENAGNSINDHGLVAGFANLPDNNSRHATLWLYGFRFDLGTLGGPNSNVPWPVKNTNGLIAGIAQTTTPQFLRDTDTRCGDVPRRRVGGRQDPRTAHARWR